MFGTKILRASRQHSWVRPVFRDVIRAEGKPRLTGDRKRDAQIHEMNRQDNMANIFTVLNFMGKMKIIKPGDNPIVTGCKALFQNVRSKGGNQAAHLMPCQILITGKEPSQYFINPGITDEDISLDRFLLAASIRGAFAATDDLPRNFNYVDWLVEQYGSIKGFVKGSEFALKEGLSARESSELDFGVIGHAVHMCNTYERDSTNEKKTAHEVAFIKLSKNINAPGKNPEDIQAQLEILEGYRETAKEYEPYVLTNQGMRATQLMFNDIK